MRSVRSLCMVALLFLLTCPFVPACVVAAGPATAIDMPLTPINITESITLVAYILRAELRCTEAGCGVNVEQTYQIRNQGQEVILQLGVAATEGLPDYVLRLEGEEEALPLGVASGEYAATYSVRLGRNEQKRLVLAASHPPQQGRIVSWLCQMPYLGPWGVIHGARLEFRFPQPVTDDALLMVQPGNPSVGVGELLYWDYETLRDPQNMQVVALSPAAWQEYQELRRAQRHDGLARFYEALYQEAGENGIPMADPYARALAEWMAAVGDKPDDLNARQNLARLYRARADVVPSSRLNYLLLLAEQLDVMREQTGDMEMANELVRVYEEASEIASKSGDPAAALKYLRQASEVPGGGSPGDQELLALRLALSMAQEGQIAEALQQVQDILAPEVRQMLERYMPPFASARAEMVHGPTQSTVWYHFSLYPPAASKVLARLDELAVVLRGVGNSQVFWQSPAMSTAVVPTMAPITVTLSMTMTYALPAELQAGSQTVVESLAADPDLISAFLAAPWRSAPTTYHVERGLWQDHLLYKARADFTPLQAPWEEGSDYVRWQLVELRGAIPEGERAQTERQLAILMLEQQGQVWELIPAGTYYIQRVEHPDFPNYRPAWFVAWGQERTLNATQGFYRWDRVLGIVGGAVLLMVIVLFGTLRRL